MHKARFTHKFFYKCFVQLIIAKPARFSPETIRFYFQKSIKILLLSGVLGCVTLIIIFYPGEPLMRRLPTFIALLNCVMPAVMCHASEIDELALVMRQLDQVQAGLDRARVVANQNQCKHPGKTNHSLLEIFRHTDYVP